MSSPLYLSSHSQSPDPVGFTPYIILKYSLSLNLCRVQGKSLTYVMSKYLKAMNKVSKLSGKIVLFSYVDNTPSHWLREQGSNEKSSLSLEPMSSIRDSRGAGLRTPYHPIPPVRDLVGTYEHPDVMSEPCKLSSQPPHRALPRPPWGLGPFTLHVQSTLGGGGRHILERGQALEVDAGPFGPFGLKE